MVPVSGIGGLLWLVWLGDAEPLAASSHFLWAWVELAEAEGFASFSGADSGLLGIVALGWAGEGVGERTPVGVGVDPRDLVAFAVFVDVSKSSGLRPFADDVATLALEF